MLVSHSGPPACGQKAFDWTNGRSAPMKNPDVTARSSAPDAPHIWSYTLMRWLNRVRTVALPLALAALCLWIAVSDLPIRKQAPHSALFALGIATTASAVIPHVPTPLRAHVLAAFAASALFLLGASIAGVTFQANARPISLRRTLRAAIAARA